MNYRPYVFFAGEFKVSMPLVFSFDHWQHTSTAERLIVSNIDDRDCVIRQRRPNDAVWGVVLYADVEDKSIELNNINVVIERNIPCWPNPHVLKKMLDRYDVLLECSQAGFIDHDIFVDDKFTTTPLLHFPHVLKMGNVHRGEGKYLINDVSDYPSITGKFSIEPFFKGDSIRSLIIGDDTFGIKVDNETSWIKNSSGADINEYKLSNEIIDHSRQIAKHFGLDVAGVDYIVNKEGHHFLEINQYPGLSGFDHIQDSAKKFLKERMIKIEIDGDSRLC